MKKLATKSVWLLLSVVLASLFGYSFHFLASRALGPAAYGYYTVLMALMIAFLRPLEAISPLVARTLIENPTANRQFLLRDFASLALLTGTILGAVQFIFLLFWTPPKGPSELAVFFISGLTILVWACLYFYRGVLQSRYQDNPLLYNRPSELLGRLLSGVLLFILGKGVLPAILSGLVGAVAAVIQGFFYTGTELNLTYKIDRAIIAEYAKILLITLPGGLFISLDMIIAGKIFSPFNCGQYAIVNMIGKGILLYALAASPLVYPRLVKHRVSKKGAYYLGLGYLFAGLVFFAAFIFFAFYGEETIGLLFGRSYTPAAGYLPIYIIVMFPLCLNYGVINLKAATGGWSEGIFLWVLLAGYTVVLLSSPADFFDYFTRIGIFQSLTATAGWLFGAVKTRHTRR
ncbi:MAG: hypothetical protein KKC80_02480 [Candidatus Margulisbacteria bacterium]|nr:hypothetical protein [Candidatus Margulisiibacteriota bacterium]MBU1616379.1 hypothetical protein [Candidatus Margulisiibacteriota bacterium]